jgi:hypothetical protein
MKNDQNNSITDIKLLPELDISASSDALNILISHDYYSSDTDNGRILLKSLLNALLYSGKEIDNLFLLDSGVKLIDAEAESYPLLIKLIGISDKAYICSDSVQHFNIDPVYFPERLSSLSADEMFGIILTCNSFLHI